MVNWLIDNYRVPAGRACRCVGLVHSMFNYRHHPKDDTLKKVRMREIAQTRIRYGFKRICILMRREGFMDNHNRTYRIYKSIGLILREPKDKSI